MSEYLTEITSDEALLFSWFDTMNSSTQSDRSSCDEEQSSSPFSEQDDWGFWTQDTLHVSTASTFNSFQFQTNQQHSRSNTPTTSLVNDKHDEIRFESESDFEIPIQQKQLSPTEDEDEKPLRRQVPLGLEHQVILPTVGSNIDKEKERTLAGELQYDLESFSGFDDLLALMKEKKINDVDKDRIFHQLHLCQYQTEKIEPLLQPSINEWTPLEKSQFETCMEHSKMCPKWVSSWTCSNAQHKKLYPRTDWSGAQQLIKTKTQPQIVEYYWKWLKSQRREEWLQTLDTPSELKVKSKKRNRTEFEQEEDTCFPTHIPYIDDFFETVSSSIFHISK